MPVSVGKAACLQSNDDRNINRSDTGKIRKERKNMTNVDEIIDKFAKCHDNKVAIAFTKSIGELLKLNGVTAHYTEYNSDVMTEDEISKRYGIVFDSLDFTEHDKVFKDEIRELKKHIEKLKSIRMRCRESARDSFDRGNYGALCVVGVDELKENNSTAELPFDAIEVANFLINEKYEYRNIECRKYEIEDLEQIAEHLLVYCKHNKEE